MVSFAVTTAQECGVQTMFGLTLTWRRWRSWRCEYIYLVYFSSWVISSSLDMAKNVKSVRVSFAGLCPSTLKMVLMAQLHGQSLLRRRLLWWWRSWRQGQEWEDLNWKTSLSEWLHLMRLACVRDVKNWAGTAKREVTCKLFQIYLEVCICKMHGYYNTYDLTSICRNL